MKTGQDQILKIILFTFFLIKQLFFEILPQDDCKDFMKTNNLYNVE